MSSNSDQTCINLFIDTNSWLSFFHFSSDDLEELHKLAVLIDEGQVRLYLPEQVVNEYLRNRENKIADAIRQLQAEKLSDGFPQVCREHREFEALQAALKEYKRLKSVIISDVQEACHSKTFKADSTIGELFRKSTRIPISEAILVRARLRFDLGNPPGKDHSYGDAVNWESLLDAVPDNEVLHLVSDDKDFRSPIGENTFSPFLEREWRREKKSQIAYHRRLSGFLRERFPHIKLASEFKKESLIGKLAASDNFAQSRSELRKIAQIGDLNSAQLNDLVAAIVGNNQVYWIIDDSDMEAWVDQLIAGREGEIEPKLLRMLYRHLKRLPGQGDSSEHLNEEDAV